ncbi:unnamed protein product, partial [Chrysoparadoxa australica]
MAAPSGNLMEWFQHNSGTTSGITVEDKGGDDGLSIVTSMALEKGQEVLRVPLALCITVDSAKATELGPILAAQEPMDSDEILALHLMLERKKGKESRFHQYISTLPTAMDTPLFWSDEEVAGLLKGTMVQVLTEMMSVQLEKDWKELHEPLMDANPSLLGGLTIEDYRWALSCIWSRGFEGGVEGQKCMVPVANAANHDPFQAGVEHLSDIVTFETATQSFVYKAGRHYEPGEEFYIIYGPYTNAKLLYTYGFVLPVNKFFGVDYWVRVPSTDELAGRKQSLLSAHPLTQQQTYDFRGTLLGNAISPALMATARIIQARPSDLRDNGAAALSGKMISPSNEIAAMTVLARQLQGKLKHLEECTGKIAEDEKLLKEDSCGKRERMAIQVRLEDKAVIRDSIQLLEAGAEKCAK